MHSPMNWKLVDVIQETFHPFLNYFDLVYEVEKEGTVSIYHYYMVSRKTREEILNESIDTLKLMVSSYLFIIKILTQRKSHFSSQGNSALLSETI